MSETYEEREERLYRERVARAIETYRVGTKVYAPDTISFLIMEGEVTRIERGRYDSQGYFREGDGDEVQFVAKVRKAWWRDGGWDPKKPAGVRKRELVIATGKEHYDDEFLRQGSSEWKFFADRRKAAASLVWYIGRKLEEEEHTRNDLLEQRRMWGEGEL